MRRARGAGHPPAPLLWSTFMATRSKKADPDTGSALAFAALVALLAVLFLFT